VSPQCNARGPATPITLLVAVDSSWDDTSQMNGAQMQIPCSSLADATRWQDALCFGRRWGQRPEERKDELMKALQVDSLDSPIGTIVLVVDGEQLCSLDFGDYHQRMMTLLEQRYGPVSLTTTVDPCGFSSRMRAYFATAELHLTAGLAATLNATTPLFGTLVAALWLKEAITMNKWIGLLLGVLGVAVLVGWSPFPFTAALALSVAASLGAAACYGVAGVYTKVKAQGASPLAVATCSQVGASLFLLPLTFVAPPKHLPTLPVLMAVGILALFCTALAYLLFFRLIKNIGPTRAMTVTFLSPVFGVLWGVLLLGEPLIWSSVIGFAIVLTGTGLVTGVRVRRKKPVLAASQEHHPSHMRT